MPQAANTDLFSPSAPKAHNSECQNLQFPLRIEPSYVTVDKSAVRGFLFLSPSALMGYAETL